MPSNVSTLMSNAVNVRTHLRDADLVIGAVLRVGARTPMLVTRGDLKLMKPRSVVVDVAVDQGGCFETTRPTTHSNPVYVEENVVHYWSQISPGLWQGPQHSPSQRHCALRIDLAEKGWRRALKESDTLLSGLNAAYGQLCQPAVAACFGMPSVDARDLACAAGGEGCR